MEIKDGKKVDDDFAEKYGYNSAQSFLRAFKDYYGVSVQNIMSSDCHIRSFNPPSISFVLDKDVDLEYTLIDIEDISISAIKGLSNVDNDTVCCESVWNKFNALDQDFLKSLSEDGKSYASYQNGENAIICHIGIKTNEQNSMSKFTIQAGRFLSFSCPVEASEKHINRLYEIIRYRFIPSSPFVYDDQRPNIEIFPLGEGQSFEILIPIKSK